MISTNTFSNLDYFYFNLEIFGISYVIVQDIQTFTDVFYYAFLLTIIASS